jgi:cytochrome c553
MHKIFVTLIVAGFTVTAGAFAIIESGVYNVAATDHHWPLTHWLIETARMRSIERHASGIIPPPGLDDPARLVFGTEHFAAHCAVCHGAPGVPPGDIARGLYPPPPNLAAAASRYTPGELFWIVRHGIKSTGMPAWNDHSEDELWATVAFLEKLPTLDEPAYARLVMQTIAEGGHHHHSGLTEPADSDTRKY